MLDGGGAGNVITVTAPDVTVRGLTIRESGRDLMAMNSGIFLQKTAERATIEDNRFVGNLFGIYVHGAAGSGSCATSWKACEGAASTREETASRCETQPT